MTGASSGYNPDPLPTLWLCHQARPAPGTSPAWLSGHERQTADRLSGTRHQEYLTSRWLIRQALARASAEPPERCQPVSGRPTRSVNPPGWHLSLSHSHGLSACAIHRHGPLGVDIEPRRRHPQWQKVVRRWFTPVEQDWLLARDDSNEFLIVWTLKEAWLKATGRGIANNLQTLEVRPGFDLCGDQPDPAWRASSYECEGFVVSLVYRNDPAPRTADWPAIQLLAPPDDALTLHPAEPLETTWEPLLQRTIAANYDYPGG